MRLTEVTFGLVRRSSANAELQRAINNGKCVHAYLVVGEKGVGKRSFALFAAASVICGHEFCGCNKCRAVVAGEHPDISVIAPEGKQIKIDSIREMIADSFIRPYEAPSKVYVITEADKMNVNAQNCLIKSLEEPPGRVVFILTAQSVKGLLPTVVSRCCILRMHPARAEDVAAELMDKYSVSASEAEAIARDSGGNMARAEAIHLGGEHFGNRDSAISAIDAIIRRDPLRAIDAMGACKDSVNELIDQMEVWVRDLVLCSCGSSDRITNRDRADVVAEQGERTNINQLYVMLRALGEARNRLTRNTQVLTVIEGLALEMMEE